MSVSRSRRSRLPLATFALLSVVVCIRAATHDELPQCGLSGVYKARQNIIESPNYPNQYPPNTCWDYVVRSPYRCPTKFHIQFLDFRLESSPNCTNDYLAIGLENDGDDMDLLCGQVIGIKKYHTPDGILRLRFFADDSPWSTSRGFKLLVTRLACERENLLFDNLDPNDEDTVQVSAPTLELQPPHATLAQMFRNFSESEQYKIYPTQPLFGWNLPGQLPLSPPSSLSGNYAAQVPQLSVSTQTDGQPVTKERPCVSTKTEDKQLSMLPQYGAKPYWHNQQAPLSADQFVSAFQSQQPRPQLLLKSNNAVPAFQARQQLDTQFGVTPTAQHCCSTSFHQKHFYLSSPGFPRTAFTSLLPAQQRDCLFVLEKHLLNVCRLRIEFKFFDFGQTFAGNGDIHGDMDVAISNTHDVCTEDFLEIGSERFCGCRTGFVHTTRWGLGSQKIRMRMGYSGVPSSGFLVEIFQEVCRETGLIQQQLPNVGTNLGIQPSGGEAGSVGEALGGQQPAQYPLLPAVFGQQQWPMYPQKAFYPLPPAYLPQQQQHQAFLGSHTQSPPAQQFWAPPIQFSLAPQMAQFRQARTLDHGKVASAAQPVTVVETNSTRKEYYYLDGDEAFTRASLADEPDDPDSVAAPLSAKPRDRCSFSTMDALRLTVDPLWITKPTCYTPLRNWFSNVFG